MYMVMRVPAYDEFCLNAVVLSFCVPKIGEKCPNIWQRQAAIQLDPGKTVQLRDSTRLRCCQSVTRDFERFS